MLEGLRVLVVDGDQATVDGLRAILSGQGADVRTATVGDVAVTLVSREWHPHVLLTDLRLPDMEGEQLARIIAKRDGHPLALVAVTSNPEPRVARVARDRGFLRCLVKPVDPYDLASALFAASRTVPR